ncbi:MAG: AAA family ATPase [Desulfuromonadaceae bacterium]|nr:AAA family ATPase [Desulfuromonadaceae bacterium]MDD2849347.1 AAA family ATPase [Desulfuromonadaceae bacterium]MDD4129406.1 AAA family ATPase [Desulfuromonadaceae bacterium]
MKILRLSFKNLNSLAGVWEIDFKHPEYVSSGIFAITGPTGAGKSTILDAICLALYGQTPRLGRITQGENEIMSRQTGECFAEVEFETVKGCFRCHWSQHRSRKQADGQLQSPRHEIAVAETGIIIESKLRAVAEKVEDVTGMDFDRFTRSMLLAQGSFAAFLQARPDERAPILEQITGTAIYSRISIKVHERTTEARKRLAELRAELGGIILLSPAEVDALYLEMTELQRKEVILTATVAEVREAQSWRERIMVLESELLQLGQEQLAFEERKAAAAPQLERLALAGRALKLSGDHAHILSLRTMHEREQGEYAVLIARLPQLQLDWQAAFEALEQAEADLATVRGVQAQEAELIRMTRELDVRIGEAQTRLQGIAVESEKTLRQTNAYRQVIAGCDQRMNSLGAELRVVTEFLDEHLADAGLAGALTGIEQQLKALNAATTQCAALQERLTRQTSLVENASLAHRHADSVWLLAQQAVTVEEQRLAELHAGCEALLQGRDLAAWRVDAEMLAARQSRFGALQEAVTRIGDDTAKQAELKLRLKVLVRKQQDLVKQELALSGECELREQVTSRLQDNVILLNRVRSLEDDRRQLVDGSPCPLCGSAEHPYAAGNIPLLDEAQAELKLALESAKLTVGQLGSVREELVAVSKDLQQADLEQQELQTRLERDNSFCTEVSAELGVFCKAGVSADEVESAIRLASDANSEAMVSRRAMIHGIERQEQDVRSAQSALAVAKDELAGHDKARLAAQLGLENAQTERASLEDEVASLNTSLDRVLTEVRSTVASYGYSSIVPERSDEILADLAARNSSFIQHQLSRDLLHDRRIEVSAEREKQLALLAESEKNLIDLEQQLRDKRTELDRVVEQRLEQFGERTTDNEEKRLAATVAKAGEVRETALQQQNRLQGERAALTQQLERLTQSLTRSGEQRSSLETAFTLRLAENGFADEAAYLLACLPQERFDELAREADALRTEETTLQTRREDRSASLAGELNRALTDKPLELIREEYAVVTGQLHELQKGGGALEQRVQQHAEQQQRHQTRLQAIELLKSECERWERLHSLIGSGDGKKFRNFAQGLTFELMVAHANRQLQKMSDRYILIRDSSEPLELNVIDNYQAGEIRSTKNLSGGESFIASLALSLGLSSMASRNVRVDSLFLDEGFGTLDEDALETALETLSGLQQDGKLIGIISHVPALKERIGTQIQVESGSAGRSTLSGPGCRRLP